MTGLAPGARSAQGAIKRGLRTPHPGRARVQCCILPPPTYAVNGGSCVSTADARLARPAGTQALEATPSLSLYCCTQVGVTGDPDIDA